MSLQHFAKRLLLALFFVTVVVVASTPSVRRANATGPAPFLITPYFGTKGINTWFDHQYPDYNRNLQIVIYDGTVASSQNGVCGWDSQGNAIAYFTQPNGQGQCIWYEGHDGIDFDMQYEHVVAAADGVVTRARWDVQNCHNGDNCNYGLVVEINHGNGYFTRYGHLSAIAVTEGQPVSAGQIVGTSGNTGHSSGAHLHFGVFLNDTNHPVDPFGWSGTGADPWAQQQNGATSYCFWKDGEWANVCGRTRRPIPEPVNGGATFTYVTTDNTGGFSKGENNGVMPPPFNNACTGNCANWTYYNNEMYSTLVNGSTPDSWAKWQAAVSPNGGMYEVFVYVPLGTNATSWQAPYTIRYLNNATQITALVDQYGLGNQWVSLGTYYMTSNDYIFTTDATDEGLGVHCGVGQYCRLGADTVKFVRRGTTYLPYLNTTDNWMSTVTIRNDGGGPAKMYLSLFDNAGSLRCSNFSDVASHAIQSFAVTAASCPPAKAAIVDASQDVVVVAREENGTELNEYNGILASGGSDGWERAGDTVYVPLIKRNRYGRSSKLYIMNAGDQTTAVQVRFSDVINGQGIITPTYSLDINASVRVRADDCTASTNRCSVKITSPTGQPLAVTVLEQDDVTTLNRITYSGFSSGATQNFAPIVKRNRYGKTTGLAVENVGAVPTNITVMCYDTSGGSSQCGSQNNLAPNATAVFTPLGVPDNYVGSARVTSSGQPIITAIYESGSPTQQVAAAPLSGTSFAYVPELYGNHSMGGQTWDSGIAIQNASASSVDVTVTYYDQGGNPVDLPKHITNLSSYRVWILNRASGNLPNGFAGSAVITANHPVVAIANHFHTGSGDTNASYTVPNR